ncbi:hypothetical protein HLA99_15225 [Microbacterium ulmi]|uniref:Uncharacterized protein n=1 Tax=Microbacterium ulmi TaxID=179095 RepID=A0A7Y2M2N4_9MICO|nr:hypothetical protein [Microbacterium ulmi]NNH05197.1 hypothetical protein [Microbacterium ulmi]
MRALRGVSAASVATLLASAAHTLSGGGAPHPLLLSAVAVLAAPAAVALAGRRLALWRVALTVLASQGLFHVAFALSGDLGGGVSVPGHVHGAVALPTIAITPEVPDAGMIAGHVAAALVTIAVAHRGEKALRDLGRGILRLLRRRVVAPSVRRPLVVLAAVGRIARTTSIVLSGASGRGPPVVAAAR